MSCTRVLRNRRGVRSVAFLVLLASVTLTSAGASAAYASSAISDVVSDMPAAPVEEHEDGKSDSELPWLFAVFFITWAAFFGYVFLMSRRQREMQREIAALSLALQEREQREAESKAAATDG